MKHLSPLGGTGTLRAARKKTNTTNGNITPLPVLIEARAGGEVRGWSRHGTDLTARLGSLLAPFAEVAPGTTFDGELVAVSERDGEPIQDFAAVTRAVFTGRPAATDRLRFVAFDLLAVAGEDVRARPWEDRDACLHETLPVCERVRLAVSQPATLAAHEAIVALGFEGTVLKRVGSAYRPGRHRTWIKRFVDIKKVAVSWRHRGAVPKSAGFCGPEPLRLIPGAIRPGRLVRCARACRRRGEAVPDPAGRPEAT